VGGLYNLFLFKQLHVGCTYDQANLPTLMTYLGDASGNAGEAVSFTYHPQMALNAVVGSGPFPYVLSTTYEAVGRVDVRTHTQM